MLAGRATMVKENSQWHFFYKVESKKLQKTMSPEQSFPINRQDSGIRAKFCARDSEEDWIG